MFNGTGYLRFCKMVVVSVLCGECSREESIENGSVQQLDTTQKKALLYHRWQKLI